MCSFLQLKIASVGIIDFLISFLHRSRYTLRELFIVLDLGKLKDIVNKI